MSVAEYSCTRPRLTAAGQMVAWFLVGDNVETHVGMGRPKSCGESSGLRHHLHPSHRCEHLRCGHGQTVGGFCSCSPTARYTSALKREPQRDASFVEEPVAVAGQRGTDREVPAEIGRAGQQGPHGGHAA